MTGQRLATLPRCDFWVPGLRAGHSFMCSRSPFPFAPHTSTIDGREHNKKMPAWRLSQKQYDSCFHGPSRSNVRALTDPGPPGSCFEGLKIVLSRTGSAGLINECSCFDGPIAESVCA